MGNSMEKKKQTEIRQEIERTVARLFSGEIDIELAATITCDCLYYIDEVAQPELGCLAEQINVFEMYYILGELWDCRDGTYQFISEADREAAINEYRNQLLELFRRWVALKTQSILIAS